MSKTSPFQAVHERMGANFADFGGWQLPADYGNTAAENVALKENCAAFDLSSFGRIVVKGRDATELLNKYCGSEAGSISEGNWIWTKISDINGDFVDIGRIFKAGDVFTITTSPSKREAVFTILTSTGTDFVEIEDITEKTAMLALYGPKAVETLTKILPVDIPDLYNGNVVRKSFFFITVTIIRGSCNGADGMELVCPVSAASFAGGAVEKYRDRENITPAGMNCLNGSFKAAAGANKIPFENAGDISLF